MTWSRRAVPSRPSADAAGESINIAVLSGQGTLYVDQVHGGSAVQILNRLGPRIPLHATPNGKVLLAGVLRRVTEHACTDRDALREEPDR